MLADDDNDPHVARGLQLQLAIPIYPAELPPLTVSEPLWTRGAQRAFGSGATSTVLDSQLDRAGLQPPSSPKLGPGGLRPGSSASAHAGE